MNAYLNELVRYLVTQSWQIALLTLAVAMITVALRHRSAHIRYLLWLIVLAKCLVPPIYMVPLHILPPVTLGGIPDVLFQADWPVGRSGVSRPASPQESVAQVQTTNSVAQDPQVNKPRLSLTGWIGIIWILGAGTYMTINLLRALRGHYWLRKSRQPLPVNMLVGTTDILRAYGLRRLPEIWIVEGVGQPFVWGFIRGNIYVPPSFLTIESPEHRRNVLAHELSHIVRFDAAVNFLQVIAQAMFWFHPFVWWVNKRIRFEREKCCDETAVAHLHTPAKDYCNAVVETLANMTKSNRPVPSLAVVGPIRNIEERMKTMLKPGKEFYTRPSLRTGLVVLFVAICTVPTTWVLSTQGGTNEAIAVPETAIVTPAVTPSPAMVTYAVAATARLGDLIQTFHDPNESGKSWFGYSIARMGDNLLVGAATNRATYLFDGSTGKLLRTFVAPPTTKGQVFGWYVATVGENVLVGDPADETEGERSGRVHLFNGRTGEFLRTFVNPKPEVYMTFGQAVAGMSGNRVVIGATGKEVSTNGPGAAFLFDASTGKMLQIFEKPKTAKKANPMVACITVHGENVLVGAPEDDTGAEEAGCVYMFDSSTGKLLRTFANPTPTVRANFGNWIATAGKNILVAAGGTPIDGKQAGAAYLFDCETGKLLRTFMNPAPGEVEKKTGFGDLFGRCVAFVGNNVLIGATCCDTDIKNSGAAYLFDGSTGQLLHKFINPNPVVNGRFGVQVGALGSNILIAAYNPYDNSPGAVYLFKGVD